YAGLRRHLTDLTELISVRGEELLRVPDVLLRDREAMPQGRVISRVQSQQLGLGSQHLGRGGRYVLEQVQVPAGDLVDGQRRRVDDAPEPVASGHGVEKLAQSVAEIHARGQPGVPGRDGDGLSGADWHRLVSVERREIRAHLVELRALAKKVLQPSHSQRTG